MSGPVYSAGLELREAGDGSRLLEAQFPYNSLAVIDSGGNGRRPKKEQFSPGAFDFAINDPDREIHLLVGHSYDKPLASKHAGSLTFKDTAAALILSAVIAPSIQESSWWRDFEAAYGAGLMLGLSPGFRVPPADVVPDGEVTEEEDPKLGKALIRTINAAVLFEMSLVTRPAYSETAVDLRAMAQWDRCHKDNFAAFRWR